MQVSVPIYQSELSPAKQRGRMVGGHGVLIVCAYVRVFRSSSTMLHLLTRDIVQARAARTGLGCFFAAPAVGWHLALSLQIVAPLTLLIGSPGLPESPG